MTSQLKGQLNSNVFFISLPQCKMGLNKTFRSINHVCNENHIIGEPLLTHGKVLLVNAMLGNKNELN